MNLSLETSWLALLEEEFQKPYMKNLEDFLASEFKKGTVIYPPPNLLIR
jgi:uracil-DNA glycosylase